ncbi:hypothetical protein [Pontibacter pamirensis]|uniref:hypothetical protein n=1 Tax=Pontibacter pamirensis TaxID=2562824 RepID=UPI0013898589|nr:hypothetical protein [Pontibacter pamirensis]
MKAVKSLFVCLICATAAYGQKVEVAGQLNSGLAKFGGESAASTTTMHSLGANRFFTLNPYGSRFASSYGMSVQVQRVTRANFLLGAQAGAEVLRNRVHIDGVYVYGPVYSSFIEYREASGKTILRNDFINLYPYFGYRVKAGAVDLDFNVGPELGIGLKSGVKGEATAADGAVYTANFERSDPETDIRARVGVTAYCRHVGLSASYAHGITNYLRGYDGSNPEVYARVFRLGLLYRL